MSRPPFTGEYIEYEDVEECCVCIEELTTDDEIWVDQDRRIAVHMECIPNLPRVNDYGEDIDYELVPVECESPEEDLELN